MSNQPAFSLGRIVFTPVHAPRLQLGGRRPPNDRNRGRRRGRTLRFSGFRSLQPRSALHFSAIAALGMIVTAALVSTSALASQQTSRSLPSLGGTYRCEGEAKTCAVSGSTFTVTQSGNELQIKNDKGEMGNGRLISNISLSVGPIWNMLGVLSPDNRAIQWSNGTTWRKQ